MAATVPPAAITEVLSNEVFTSLNIQKPDVYRQLVLARGDQGLDYFDMLKMFGNVEPIADVQSVHYEDDWTIETFHSNAQVTQNVAGGNITIRLQAADLDANLKFYPRLWDTVMFPNRVTGQIITITGAGTANVDVVIRPNKSTDVIGTVAAGQELTIVSNAFSEDSEQPDGRFSKTRRFTSYTQIVKEAFVVTGTAGTNETWWNLVNIDGKAQYVIKGQKDMDYRIRQQIIGACLWQKATDNTINDSATGYDVQTTEGLDPYIRANGNLINYTPGLFSVKKFNELDNTLEREFAPQEVLCLFGTQLAQENEDTLVNYLKNTNIDYAVSKMANTYFNGDKGFMIDMGFSYLTKAQRTFCFKRMPILNHPKLTGASGYTQSGLGYVIPLGRGKDPVNKQMIPYVGMIYKKLGADNRMMEIWDVSGAGPVRKVIGRDRAQYYMRSNAGSRHMGGNQMIVLQN